MPQQEKIIAFKAIAEKKRRKAQRNLIHFAMYHKANYVPNWHHYLIADRLELLVQKKIKRLIINMPPRHGKSELLSVSFPPWYLANKQNSFIIATSYNSGFAAEQGRKARNVVTSPEFNKLFPRLRMSQDTLAKLNWILEERSENRAERKVWGTYTGAGIDGGITGKGADVLIIDDPHKNLAEAKSKTIRESVYDWYKETALPRLEPDNSICICMTRWDEEDLTGKVLGNVQPGDLPWAVLSLPAIADEDETFEIFNPDYIEEIGRYVGRKAGEALWETKYNVDDLLQKRSDGEIGTHGFNAQYQQQPAPDTGGLFKRENFRYCELIDGIYHLFTDNGIKYITSKDCTRIMTFDPSVKNTEQSDYTVCATWDITHDSDMILVNVYRKKMEGTDHLNLITSLYNSLKPQLIFIESIAYQTTLIQSILKTGLPVKELKADRDKYTRALPAAAKTEAHKIYFLKFLPELYDIETELCQFPNAKHDDFVDCMAYAAIKAPEYSSKMIFPKFQTDKTNNYDKYSGFHTRGTNLNGFN